MKALNVEKLMDVLDKEVRIYSDLQEISKNKTDIIVKGKVGELENLTKLEQSLVLRLGRLEKEREKLMDDLAGQIGTEPESITITEIMKHVTGEDKKRLKKYQQDTVNCLNEIKNSNELNSKLIKSSLDYIDFSINLLAASDSANNYESNGKIGSGKKRNIFDMKL